MKTLIRILMMLGAVVLTVLIMAGSQKAFGQNQGAPMPFVQPQFFSNSFLPCGGCVLFSYAAGTTNPLATYTDGTLQTSNGTSITLNSLGRPSGSGGIWLLPQAYKFVLQTAGGATIWTQDNIYDLAQLFSTSQNCAAQVGATASIKITACANALPATGGTVDARGLTGAQSWTTDAFSGITKPIDFVCGASTFTVSTSSTIPSNVNLIAGQGCIFSVNAGITLTVNAPVDAGDYNIFAGSGNLRLRGPLKLVWWLNGGTGTAASPYTSADGTGGLLPAWNALTNAAGTYPDAATIYAPCAQISVTVAPILYHEVLYGSAPNNQPYPILKGCGIGNTIFQTAAGIAGPNITNNAGGAYTGGVVEDLTIFCGDKTVTGLRLNHTTRSSVHRVQVSSCSIGLDLSAGYQVSVTDSIFQSSNTNIRIENLINDVEIANSEVGNALVAGIDCRGAGSENNVCGRNLGFRNLDLESSPTGIFFGSGHYISVDRMECESMSTACLSFGKDSSGNEGETPSWITVQHMVVTGAGVPIHIDDIGIYSVYSNSSNPEIELSVGNTTFYSASPGSTVTVSASSGGYTVINTGHILTTGNLGYSVPSGVTLPLALSYDGNPKLIDTSTGATIVGSTLTESALSNATQVYVNANGSDGNSQIVTTHGTGGTTKPLEFFIDSTLTATEQTTGGWDFGSSAFNANVTGGSTGQIRVAGSIASAAAANGFLAFTANSANATAFEFLAGTTNEILSSAIGGGTIEPVAVVVGGTTVETFGVSGGGGGVAIGSPTGGVPATGQLNLQSSVFLNNTKIIDGSTGIYNVPTGGSTTISTGVGSVKMSSANNATNTAWIPMSYAGTTYFVPAWTTNAP